MESFKINNNKNKLIKKENKSRSLKATIYDAATGRILAKLLKMKSNGSYTVTGVSKIFGVSRVTVYKWLKNKKLKSLFNEDVMKFYRQRQKEQ